MGQFLKRHEKHPLRHDEIVCEGFQRMSVKDAARRIEHQLLQDTFSLVRMSVDSKSQQSFIESSLTKAHKHLNAECMEHLQHFL